MERVHPLDTEPLLVRLLTEAAGVPPWRVHARGGLRPGLSRHRHAVARLLRLLCWLLVVGAAGTAAVAADPQAAVDEDAVLHFGTAYPRRDEFGDLPRFCQVKIEMLRLKREVKPWPQELVAEAEVWEEIFGRRAWSYMHHYCAGINRIIRFEKSVRLGIGSSENMTKMQRATLAYALDEFEMTCRQFKAEGVSPLLPECLVNHAKVLQLLGRTDEAVAKLEEALSDAPESDIVYLAMAQMLLDEGNKDTARQVLKVGYERTHGAESIGAMLSSLE